MPAADAGTGARTAKEWRGKSAAAPSLRGPRTDGAGLLRSLFPVTAAPA